MNNILEKILLTLFLILGLNVINITHAQENELQLCPIQGHVSMRLEGTVKNGQLLGYIDNKFVNWFVMMGNIQGYYNGNFMTLRLEELRYNELSLIGWIGSYRVNWRTFGGYFNEQVYCLQ